MGATVLCGLPSSGKLSCPGRRWACVRARGWPGGGWLCLCVSVSCRPRRGGIYNQAIMLIYRARIKPRHHAWTASQLPSAAVMALRVGVRARSGGGGCYWSPCIAPWLELRRRTIALAFMAAMASSGGSRCGGGCLGRLPPLRKFSHKKSPAKIPGIWRLMKFPPLVCIRECAYTRGRRKKFFIFFISSLRS